MDQSARLRTVRLGVRVSPRVPNESKIMSPTPLHVDGEVFVVNDEEVKETGVIFISGARMNLSPYEAQELADWLHDAVKWIGKQ